VLNGTDERVMRRSGPIIVIDDDLEDQMIFEEVFKNLDVSNKLMFFADGAEALEYLSTTHDQPFLILSDINMPRIDGFEVRSRICNNDHLKVKCIPYVFFTTSVDRKAVEKAYDMCVQGFFVKPTTMTDMQKVLKKIIDYWQECYAPNYFS
jgi:CheY-like chemotaxis protein